MYFTPVCVLIRAYSYFVCVGSRLIRQEKYAVTAGVVSPYLQTYNYQAGEHMQKKRNAKGVTIVEYAIMLALIAIAIAVSAPSITSAVTGVFGKASSVMGK